MLDRGVVIGVVEKEEFQLAGGHALGALGLQLLQLAPQHGTGGFRDRAAVVLEQIAQDQGGGGLPGQDAEGGEVGLEGEIAVAGFPVGELEAGDRLHFDIDCQ